MKDSDPSIPLVCPKCGEADMLCACYTDDYYNARLQQQTPKGKIIKTKTK
jgi:hypothetical protein